MSEALATTTPATVAVARTGHASLAFTDIRHGLDIAATLQRAGMYPQFKTPEQIVAAVTRGYELGMTPHQALSSIIEIKGRFSLTAEAMRALVTANLKPGEYFLVNATDEKATAKAFRQGWPEAQEYVLTHAQLAKTDSTGANPNFKSRPRVMLSARVTSEACRMWFADITGGFYTPEEVREIVAAEELPASRPAQSNLDSVKNRLKVTTKATPEQQPVIEAESSVQHDPDTGEVSDQQDAAPEHWTDENVTEWEGEFTRCGNAAALDNVVNALKVEKLTHPIPADVNTRLSAAYRKAKARLEDAE